MALGENLVVFQVLGPRGGSRIPGASQPIASGGSDEPPSRHLIDFGVQRSITLQRVQGASDRRTPAALPPAATSSVSANRQLNGYCLRRFRCTCQLRADPKPEVTQPPHLLWNICFRETSPAALHI